MTNRNPLKQFMITFPQSGDTLKEEFTNSMPDATYACCAQEKHKDGNNHLHLVIVFEKKITKSGLLKHIARAYPNFSKSIHVGPIRSLKHSLDYINKEDTTVYEKGTIPNRKRVKFKNLDVADQERLLNQVAEEFFNREYIRLKIEHENKKN